MASGRLLSTRNQRQPAHAAPMWLPDRKRRSAASPGYLLRNLRNSAPPKLRRLTAACATSLLRTSGVTGPCVRTPDEPNWPVVSKRTLLLPIATPPNQAFADPENERLKFSANCVASEPREPPSRLKRSRAMAAKTGGPSVKRISRLPAVALAKAGESVSEVRGSNSTCAASERASEPRERSAPTQRRARERVGGVRGAEPLG